MPEALSPDIQRAQELVRSLGSMPEGIFITDHMGRDPRFLGPAEFISQGKGRAGYAMLEDGTNIPLSGVEVSPSLVGDNFPSRIRWDELYDREIIARESFHRLYGFAEGGWLWVNQHLLGRSSHEVDQLTREMIPDYDRPGSRRVLVATLGLSQQANRSSWQARDWKLFSEHELQQTNFVTGKDEFAVAVTSPYNLFRRFFPEVLIIKGWESRATSTRQFTLEFSPVGKITSPSLLGRSYRLPAYVQTDSGYRFDEKPFSWDDWRSFLRSVDAIPDTQLAQFGPAEAKAFLFAILGLQPSHVQIREGLKDGLYREVCAYCASPHGEVRQVRHGVMIDTGDSPEEVGNCSNCGGPGREWVQEAVHEH